MATIPDPNAENITIYGKRIGFIGTLKGAVLEQVQSLVQEQGGVCVMFPEAEADLVVLGEEEPTLFSGETFSYSNTHSKKNRLEDLSEETFSGEPFSGEFVSEANFLNALTHCEEEVQSLYTPGMLAELLRVSVAVIKRWYRRGYLVPRQVIKKVPYFLFEEVQVARHLVSLRDAGCTQAASCLN